MLDQERITSALRNCQIEYQIRCLEQTASTNLDIRTAAMAGGEHGLVITAEQQSAGRGRRGRIWESVTGKNLYFSILLLPEFGQEKASMLTLVAALSVTGAIREYGIDASVKWPNDVVCNGRKLCGILTELGWRADGRYFVIVGIGINVNQHIFKEEIQNTATSVFLQTQKQADREMLLRRVLELFSYYYEQFSKRGDLGGLRTEYESLLVNCGQQVRVLDPKQEWSGIALGINDAGELLVRRDGGEVEAVYAGEVSVRGIYGYV